METYQLLDSNEVGCKTVRTRGIATMSPAYQCPLQTSASNIHNGIVFNMHEYSTLLPRLTIIISTGDLLLAKLHTEAFPSAYLGPSRTKQALCSAVFLLGDGHYSLFGPTVRCITRRSADRIGNYYDVLRRPIGRALENKISLTPLFNWPGAFKETQILQPCLKQKHSQRARPCAIPATRIIQIRPRQHDPSSK